MIDPTATRVLFPDKDEIPFSISKGASTLLETHLRLGRNPTEMIIGLFVERLPLFSLPILNADKKTIGQTKKKAHRLAERCRNFVVGMLMIIDHDFTSIVPHLQIGLILGPEKHVGGCIVKDILKIRVTTDLIIRWDSLP